MNEVNKRHLWISPKSILSCAVILPHSSRTIVQSLKKSLAKLLSFQIYITKKWMFKTACR